MTAKRDSKRPKSIKRPQEAIRETIRDLEPDDRQGDVRGGRKIRGESEDKPHPHEIEGP